MKNINKVLIILTTLVSFPALASDLIVVANTDQANVSMQKRQVRDIFMGNSSNYAFKPVALSPSNQARSVFNIKIVGLTESRIQSYWAQMRFSGRKKAPQEFDSVEAMLTYVQNNKNAVAYVPAETELPDGLTVVYQTN